MTGERVSTEDLELEAQGLDGFNAIDDDGEGLPDEALAELAALDAESGGEDFEGEARQAELDELRSELAQAVDRYRSAVLAGAPDVPGDLVRGATLDEVDESLEAAKRTVTQIRARVTAELGKAEGFPVGSPARDDGNLDGLSASEKIAYGLARGRSSPSFL